MNLCKQVSAWLDQGPWPVCVTVNVSARQFQKADFVGRISRILDETGLQPGCLDLEITEAAAMQKSKIQSRK